MDIAPKDILSHVGDINKIPKENRDFAMEKSLMKKDMIELKLLSSLRGRERQMWLPQACQRGHFLEIADQYRIVIEDHCRTFDETSKALRARAMDLRQLVGDIKSIIRIMPTFEKASATLKVMSDSIKQTMDAMKTHCQISMDCVNAIEKRDKFLFGHILSRGAHGYMRYIFGGLLEIYSAVNGYSEVNAIELLSDIFSISDDPASDAWLPSNKNWYQLGFGGFFREEYIHGLPVRVNYYFLGRKRQWSNRVIGLVGGDGKEICLPYLRWLKNGSENMFSLTTPFLKPYPLFNLHLANENQIVFLTDSMKLAGSKARERTPLPWLSWYGGLEAIPYVDWEPLRGKTIYYVMSRHLHDSEKAIYETATAIHLALKDIGKVEFVDCLDMA